MLKRSCHIQALAVIEGYLFWALANCKSCITKEVVMSMVSPTSSCKDRFTQESLGPLTSEVLELECKNSKGYCVHPATLLLFSGCGDISSVFGPENTCR